ncbi:hypothetical protein [Sporosarcina ureilytica]|uniref:DUF2642 domain-containing protein n=1 Tax=Sporosarcina ureilytica TaxID=298596 RepID=A0A1D8JFQ9_9BACL|nr:hypothetical protein [Sporosarcina ureilytica]AOV07546.1 hypothetical protein BI350_08375 [Sporosarcina ureilytica]
MREQKDMEIFGSLKDTKIGVFLSGHQYLEGVLLAIKQDHIVVDVNQHVHYIAHEHIQAISKNAKDFYVSSKDVPYLDKQYLMEVLKDLQYSWVIINGSSNQAIYGVISKIIDDYIILISHQEILYIPSLIITNIYSSISESDIILMNERALLENKKIVDLTMNIETDEVDNELIKDAINTKEILEVDQADIEHSTELELTESVRPLLEDAKDNSQPISSEVKADKEIVEVQKDSTHEVLEVRKETPHVELSKKLELMKILYLTINNRKSTSQSILSEYKATEDSVTPLPEASEELANSSLDEEMEEVSDGRSADEVIKGSDIGDVNAEVSSKLESEKRVDLPIDEEVSFDLILSEEKATENSVTPLPEASEELTNSSLDEEMEEVLDGSGADEVIGGSDIGDANAEVSSKLESEERVDLPIDEEVSFELILSEYKATEDSVTPLPEASEELANSSLDEEMEEVPDGSGADKVIGGSDIGDVNAEVSSKLEFEKRVDLPIDEEVSFELILSEEKATENSVTPLPEASEELANSSLDEEMEEVSVGRSSDEVIEGSDIGDANAEVSSKLESEERVDLPIDEEASFELNLSEERVAENSVLDLAEASKELANSSVEQEVAEVLHDGYLEEYQLVEFKENLNYLQRNIEDLLNKDEEYLSEVDNQVGNEIHHTDNGVEQSFSKVQSYQKENGKPRGKRSPIHYESRPSNPIKEDNCQIHDERVITMEETAQDDTNPTHTPSRELSPKEEKEMLQKQYSSLMKHAAEYLLKLEDNIEREHSKTDIFKMPIRKISPIDKKSALEGQYISLMNHAAKMYWQLSD